MRPHRGGFGRLELAAGFPIREKGPLIHQVFETHRRRGCRGRVQGNEVPQLGLDAVELFEDLEGGGAAIRREFRVPTRCSKFFGVRPNGGREVVR